MRVFLDTNVLVSAFAARGLCWACATGDPARPCNGRRFLEVRLRYAVLRLIRPTGMVGALLTMGACSGPAAPTDATVRPGRYALTAIGTKPAPFTVVRIEVDDTLALETRIVYDTITVLDDSTARQHLSRVTVAMRVGATPTEQESLEGTFPKVILFRDDEIVLIPAPPFEGGLIIYLTRRAGELVQLIETVRVHCNAAGCVTVARATAEAHYVRQ